LCSILADTKFFREFRQFQTRYAKISFSMLSSKLCKYFLVFPLFCASSCQFWQNPSNSNVATREPEIIELRSEIPFSTKEPETFQAEVVTKSEGQEAKTFITYSQGRFFSRDGDVARLQIEANKSFLINFAKKIYVENTGKSAAQSEPSGETWPDFLTTEWLNQKAEGKFESLGQENGLSKYRVVFEASESLIFVDENYKIPVRQEFYSVEGDTKNLVYSIELQNIKLVVDEQLFEVPKDFRPVSLEEFRRNE
jgi:hypothetical protein